MITKTHDPWTQPMLEYEDKKERKGRKKIKKKVIQSRRRLKKMKTENKRNQYNIYP